MERRILHCDMNNFFAGVECMLNPELKKYPIAVCGSVEDRHGIVLAKNYNAKAYGIVTAEPVWQAKQKCPELVVVPPHYDEYIKYSRFAREIYGRFTDQVEPFGMDECWLDVTGSGIFGSAGEIAENIRCAVKKELNLTISTGVSFNKVFAKLGSDMKKPDAITVIPKSGFREKIWPLPASDMIGVGRSTTKTLERCRIRTIGELACADPRVLKMLLGKNGLMLKSFANGEDCSPVHKCGFQSPVKSIGHGITAVSDLVTNDEVHAIMLHLVQEIAHNLRVHEKLAGGVAIHIKSNNLAVRQWQKKLDVPTHSPFTLAEEGFELFYKNYDWRLPVRAVTMTAINLVPDSCPIQLGLFTDAEKLERREKIDETVENLRERFGKDSIKSCVLYKDLKLPGHEHPSLLPGSA